MKGLVIVVYILVLVIFALVSYAVMQLKLAGIKVKDFWSFVEANQTLDRLYEFSKKYEKLSLQESAYLFKRGRRNV